ncbi:ATP-dependent helicase [Paenibacillus swuensis]|uniref:ATP-dependent helicase/deoxyribonuclease subunit B n=1 Tax=Paenibacillus swuensis TaxID=1178515 RepID=A0A172TJU8_9BACL|nr:helicase-exonuclease AddAB subunit AddB [Paenibacillus swuensis]ANE47308.1 ATP-dependent helicase [Paenibacillus swuensis]
MSIQFILGRAGSGKTRHMLDEIRDNLREKPDGEPMVLLVPEQATFGAEYELAQTPGLQGIIRVQALSFRRLAFRVMQEVGRSTRIHIDDTGKKMLLHKIIRRRAKDLRIFAKGNGQSGFIDRVNDLYNEFKRYQIDGSGLLQHIQTNGILPDKERMLQDKLHDLLLIYDEFEQELGPHHIDSEDYLATLTEQAGSSSFIKETVFWIDGFHGFTPQEFAVLEQLMIHSAKVNIALTLDKPYESGREPHELELFHPTATTMIKLRELADENGVMTEPHFVMGGEPLPRYERSFMLAHLESTFDRRIPYKGPIEMEPSVVLHSAVHRRAEVEGAAREMVRLARDRNVRWRDMALLVRNMPDYEDLLATTLTDHGIPHFFDQKRTVLHHPLAELIRSALEVVTGYWRYDAVFRCVKTGLLPAFAQQDLPSPFDIHVEGDAFTARNITRRNLDELENYVLAFGIQGGRWTDDRPWTYKLQRSLEDEPTGPNERERAELQRVDVTRRAVAEPLAAFERGLKAAKTARGMAEALYGLLDSLKAAERLERWSMDALAAGRAEKAREHRQLWGAAVDLLDQIVETMGDEAMTPEQFAGVVETGLESIRLSLVPPTLDQVLLGSMERTRSGKVRYAFLLGVNDGVVPGRLSEDGVLSEGERDRLAETGLLLAPSARRRLLDERFMIYTAMTVASDRLWVSYPLADEEGKSLLPSELIRRLKQTFPALKEGTLMGDPGVFIPSSHEEDERTPLDYIAHPERALSYLIAQLREWKKGSQIASVWWEVYNWFVSQPEWRPKLQTLLQSLFYTNEVERLSRDTSRRLYGTHLRASVSRMERFVACPFSHFMSHGLRLQERRVYRLEAPDIGQLFHAALSMIAQNLMREGVSWGALSAAECRKEANDAVDVLTPRLQSEILLSSKRFTYISRKLKDIVGRASVVLGEHARRGSFEPLRLEMDFGGPVSELPPLSFKLNNGCTMDIIGRIDRVDSAEGESGLMVRVIDYKSSQTSLRLDELYYGLALQLLTYLDVLVTHAEGWLGREAIPAGALYFHVHNPLLQVSAALSAEEAEDRVFKRFKMKGLVLAEPEAVQLMDGSLEKGHSALLPLALKADGGFYSTSSVMTRDQWGVLRKAVRSTIREIGTEITDGTVDISPIRLGPKTPCAFCAYKPVCQFDTLIEGNGYQGLAKQGKDQLWDLLREKGEHSSD